MRASEREHGDLFWGLRGGGGNFGVVTSFEYRLHPVGPEIRGGAIVWRGEDAASVLEMYRSLVGDAPRELTCVAALRLAPPAPWIAKEVHGKPIVALFVCHSGAPAEADASSRQSSRSARRSATSCSPGPMSRSRRCSTPRSRRAAATTGSPSTCVRSSRSCSRAPIAHATRLVSPHSAILIFPIDGALNGLPDGHSAVGNRDASAVLNIASAWEHAKDDAVNIEWAREAWADLRQFSTGGTYINFLTEEEGDERTLAAYRSNYERLVRLKAEWDPANLFRTNKNIDPARERT